MVVRQVQNVSANSITEGSVWKGLISFFIPIWFGTFFQQLYNTADAIIVGQFAGKEALAAVAGGTAIYINLLVGFFVGISSGASVVIAQFFGAKNHREVSRSVHTSIMLSITAGALMSVVGYLISPFAMRLIATPQDFFADSVQYLRIYFIGMIPMFVYNMGSGILRAAGDSKTPLYILIAGCIANVLFDLIFVVFLKAGVAGAAWATVLCQAFSMILILWSLVRTHQSYQISISEMKITPHLLKKMIQIGIPAGLQSVFYSSSNLIIQTNINSFGTTTAAAWAAYSRIDSIFWMTISSFGIALTTFSGQNFGAGKIDRIHSATKQGTIMGAAASVFYTFLFYAFGKYIYALFTTDAQVIADGMKMLYFLAPFFIIYMPIELLSGIIRGTGDSFIPTVLTCFGVCALRLVWLLLILPMHKTLYMLLGSYPITWIITSILFVIYYRKGKWLKRIV